MRGAVWYVTVDFSVTKHTRVIRELTKGLEDLTFNVGRDLAQRQELRYVSKIAEELQEKVENLLQMLPRERRVRRGMLSIGGKALKFLFGAALSEDLGPIIDRIEILRTRVGELVHDATERVTAAKWIRE
jgi:predicted RNA-binding protein with EMAP domain